MKLDDDLTCREIVELVTEYHEGRLSLRDRMRFEEHVGFCDSCASYLDSMRRTIEVTGHLREEDLPPELQVELLAAFRGWRTG